MLIFQNRKNKTFQSDKKRFLVTENLPNEIPTDQLRSANNVYIETRAPEDLR